MGNARQPRQRTHASDLADVLKPRVDDGSLITGARQVPGYGIDVQLSDRQAGSGQQQQMATQRRPRRLPSQAVEQTVGAPFEVGNHLRPGEVFGGDVEGVKVAGRSGAEADGGILLLAL